MIKKKHPVFIVVIIASLIVLLLSVSRPKYILRQDVEEHFERCYGEIQFVAKLFDKQVSEAKKVHVLSTPIGGIRKAFSIEIDENSYIEIVLQYRNVKYDPERGEETILLSYVITADSPDTQANIADFDTELFSALIQASSHKDVSVEKIFEFLSAPEEKYPASKYGFFKQNGEKVAKIQYLNFGGDWATVYWGIEYYEREDSSIELHYFGPISTEITYGTGDGSLSHLFLDKYKRLKI